MTKYISTILTLLSIVSCDNLNTADKEISKPTKDLPYVDSFSIKAYSGTDPVEKIDLLTLDNGTLTCKFAKVVGCEHSKVDTFYLTNDTLNFKLGTLNNKEITCRGLADIYIRLKSIDKTPKSITVNGRAIGADTYTDADEKEDNPK